MRNFCQIKECDPYTSELEVYELVKLESRIVGLEVFLAYNPSNKTSNEQLVEKYKKEHQETYNHLQATLGHHFQQVYEKVLHNENECAKLNKGKFLCLPKFYPDGSHEPWNEKDIPSLCKKDPELTKRKLRNKL